MNESEPLPHGTYDKLDDDGRGLHSSTFRLNLSASYGIGDRGCALGLGL